ncbi:GNAT family N-acetyltransferase [Microbacterium sp.]|uniref:GNAT family N-acetyltransferase n=1 Tax=Microbacterium sp. TaxID=51671 RepID=UPI0028A80B01|nr:GNAT family N-acetyltransferase [Microbacterium sp.]
MAVDPAYASTEQLALVDLALGDPRWAVALPVLQELRPHLTVELLEQVLHEGAPQGLTFTAVLVGERCVAVAGWRIIANTSAIRKLYVDDLSTAASERSRGYGRMLLDELRERAVAAGCRQLDLDSGVQRFDAHRFYLRERMNIDAHHFSRHLG